MKMVFSINQPVKPTIIKKPIESPLPSTQGSYDFFHRKPMFQGMQQTTKCTSCGK
jgi:hypothetical protein